MEVLLDKFNKYYETHRWSRERIKYEHPFTIEFVQNSSDYDLINAITKFAKDGGNIQKGGPRTANQLRKSIEANITGFRRYLLCIWDKNFDVVKWIDNKDYKMWGKGVKTIFLHRVFPDKYIPFNDKTMDGLIALKIIYGEEKFSGRFYFKMRNAIDAFIKQHQLYKFDFEKFDAMMHYIIGTDEGKALIKNLTKNNNIVHSDLSILDKLRKELLAYAESDLKAHRDDYDDYCTSLRVLNYNDNKKMTAVDIWKDTSLHIKIDIDEQFVSEENKHKIIINEKINTPRLKSTFYVKSREDMDTAKKLIKGAIEKTRG